ncbi:MAG: thioredoxin domain-containing protein [Bacteroidota bacterium]
MADQVSNASGNTGKDNPPNRLIHEKSPYLLQHAYNPVDWYPWGEEAFAKARQEDKPIFLSIGYSTCYWCHVMERESFENNDIAGLMNEHLVCIKLDREERPDIDHVYMTAVQALTGSGGWPMSVFLTHDLKPFFGGTYFPPEDRHGRPGFPTLVMKISELWHTDRKKIIESSEEITEQLRTIGAAPAGTDLPGNEVFDFAFEKFHGRFDKIFGGFGGAPKFPRPVCINFLFQYYARTGNEDALNDNLFTLRRMAEGGMYDHLGGGFHRYSVDEQWRVPHFEKMLYDQGQLVNVYIDAYKITKDDFFKDIAEDVLRYVLRNMTDPGGGFYSAEDAESAFTAENPHNKEEGVYYLWTKQEIEGRLPAAESKIFCYRYGVKETGNALHDPQSVFKGKNILYIAHSLEETANTFGLTVDEIKHILSEGKLRLYSKRGKRPRPHLDDKILTAWNGLMISAFARACQAFGKSEYLHAALGAARFISTHLYDGTKGTLRRRYRDGEARFEGTLQDYAFFTMGLLDLYEASFDTRWIDLAINITKKQLELFGDELHGGFFDSHAKDSGLILKTKEDYDGAEPAGNSIAALNLLRLGQLTDNNTWRKLAGKTIMAFGARIEHSPDILPQMLLTLDWIDGSSHEIVIVGNTDDAATRELIQAVHSQFISNKILILLDSDHNRKYLESYLPFLEGMNTIDGKAAAYVCQNYACNLPTTDTEEVRKLLVRQGDN